MTRSQHIATVNTHVNVFFVFLPGGISKEWRHIVSANCYFEGETGPIVPMFTGLSGNTWQTAKIAHESHYDVIMAPSSFCWPNLACESPLADVYPVSVLASLFQHGGPPRCESGPLRCTAGRHCLLNSRVGKNRPILYSTFINAIYRGVTWRSNSNTIWLEQLYMEPG